MALVLYGNQLNKNTAKVLIVAEYVGVKIEVAPSFEMGVTNKTHEFLTMNPISSAYAISKIPVLETPDGLICESNAIAHYVARLKGDGNLFGSSLIEWARVEQWIDFASMEVDMNISRWYYPRAGVFLAYLPPVEEIIIAALKRALTALNTHLASNTHLVGHGITLADIIMTCNLFLGFSRIMTKSFTSEFPHVERYFWTLVNQPSIRKILGEVKQVESVPPVPSNKKPASAMELTPNKKPKEELNKEAKKDVKKETAKPEAEADGEPRNPLDLSSKQRPINLHV